MGKAENEPEKSQLIAQICCILARANACAQRHHRCAIRSPFIDWYLVLGVAENAGVDAIRKKYHKLALQLHPDKNKHPKAESAFKLVSEAYFCLSDSKRKAAFDSERKNSFCSECSHPPSRRNVEGISYSGRKKFNGITQQMKNLRTRLEEEATIIEKCLKANAASKGEFPVFGAKTESPIFSPSDYRFQGYPHQRSSSFMKPESFKFFMTRNRCIHTAVKGDSRSFNVDQKNGKPVNLDMLVSSDLNEQYSVIRKSFYYRLALLLPVTCLVCWTDCLIYDTGHDSVYSSDFLFDRDSFARLSNRDLLEFIHKI